MKKIVDFIKSQTPAFYLLCLSILVSVVALIISLASGSQVGYGLKHEALFIIASIMATIFATSIIIIFNKLGDNSILTVAMLISVVLFCVALYILFISKTALMGNLWFSNLDKGNVVAEKALSQGVVGIALYFVSILLIVVSGAFLKKKTIKSE